MMLEGGANGICTNDDSFFSSLKKCGENLKQICSTLQKYFKHIRNIVKHYKRIVKLYNYDIGKSYPKFVNVLKYCKPYQKFKNLTKIL